MSKPRPSKIAFWIATESKNSDFIPLAEILNETLSRHLKNCSQEQIAETTEEIFEEVKDELNMIIANERAEGIVSSFAIDEQDDKPYIKIISSPELTLRNDLRTRSPLQFEDFCKEVLTYLGATSIRVGGVDDGGVDFVGHNLTYGTDKGPIPIKSRILVLGQSKRQAKNITLSDMRKFIGGVSKEAFEYRKKEEIGIFTPIVYAFWTTSEFNRDAKEYAQKMGIWYLNGIGLAQLALRNGFSGFTTTT